MDQVLRKEWQDFQGKHQGASKKMVARSLLDRREGEMAEGRTPGIYFEKTTFEELADLYLMDYRINRKKSLDRAERSTNHLRFFGSRQGYRNYDYRRINQYIELRLTEKAANATINRELSAYETNVQSWRTNKNRRL